MSTDLIVEPDFEQAEEYGSAVAPQGAMQQVRGTYTTAVAVQQARSLEHAKRRLLQESALAGDLFYYGWGAGREKIEGASVKLAMAAARCWGNCAVETLPVQETPDAWIFTSAFVDLETGFTLTRQFRQSKRWTVYGKHDAERKDDIRFQIGQSKAARNVILNALPEWLIDQAVEKAKEGVRTKVEAYIKSNGLPAAVDLVISGLAKSGVAEDAVLAKCEVANRNGLTVEHIVMLRGDMAAIQSGTERPETIFPMEPADGAARAKRSDLNDKLAAERRDPEPRNDPAAVLVQFDQELARLKTISEAAEACSAWSRMHPDLADEFTSRMAARQEQLRGNRGPKSNEQKTLVQ